MDDNNNSKKINITLPPDVAQGTYANLALIAHSQSEFVIDFIRAVPGIQSPTVKSRIILTPEHARRLLSALNENIARYEQEYGAIRPLSMQQQGFSFSGKGEA